MEWDRLTRTHFWPETIEFLRGLGRTLPPRGVVVNIGAYWESSTISLLYGRPDLFAFSIDPDVCEVGLGNLAHFGLNHRVFRILGKSQDVGMWWRWPIDLAYIDGDHSYEGCRADIDLWVPWVKEGGLVAFHDYGTPHTPGVVQAVDEMVAGGGFELAGRDGEDKKHVLVAYRKETA